MLSISASSPERVCMAVTKSSISASCSGVAWTTRSGPSATMFRSSSVTRLAISTMTWRDGIESGHLEIDPGQHGRACYRSPSEGGKSGVALLVVSSDAARAPAPARP